MSNSPSYGGSNTPVYQGSGKFQKSLKKLINFQDNSIDPAVILVFL